MLLMSEVQTRLDGKWWYVLDASTSPLGVLGSTGRFVPHYLLAASLNGAVWTDISHMEDL